METITIEVRKSGAFIIASVDADAASHTIVTCSDPATLARKVRSAAATIMRRGYLARVAFIGISDAQPIVAELARLPNAAGVPLGYCSTTGRFFEAKRLEGAGDIGHGLEFVWGSCPYCDRNLITFDQPGYQPGQPQPHLFYREYAQAAQHERAA